MKIARIFPRRTTATPDDALAFTTPPPKVLPDIDEVHVSVTFSYDKQKAEQLAAVSLIRIVNIRIGSHELTGLGKSCYTQ